MRSAYYRLRPWITPGLENSQVAYARELHRLVRPHITWLDLGCGHAIVPEWASREFPVFPAAPVGLDGDHAALRAHRELKLKVRGDVHRLPFSDRSFDLVTANMVVEHVSDPSALFTEVRRVLVPGGRWLLHTPNADGYTTRLANLIPSSLRPTAASLLQGRQSADVFPTFYRANTVSAIRHVAEQSGFAIEKLDLVLSSPQLLRLPPLLFLEMLWIRRLARPRRAASRPVCLCLLQRLG